MPIRDGIPQEEKRMKIKAWLIHRLGGYTHNEVFTKALELAQKMKARDVAALTDLQKIKNRGTSE
jgi:hypothetical protein